MTKRIMTTGLSLALAFSLAASTAPVFAAAAPATIRIEDEQVPLGAAKTNFKKGQSLYATKATKLFKSASTKADKVADIKANAKVTLVKSMGSWYQVKSGSKTGFVQAKLFAPVYKAKVGGTVQTTKAVALKQTASAKSKTVANVPLKKKLTIAKVSGKWVMVTYNGQQGYLDEKSYTVTSEPSVSAGGADQSESKGGTGLNQGQPADQGKGVTQATEEAVAREADTDVDGSQQQAPIADKTTAEIDSSGAGSGYVKVSILTHTGKKLNFFYKKTGGKDAFDGCRPIPAPTKYTLNQGSGDYKCMVLEDTGTGNGSYIIKAVDVTTGESDDPYLASTYTINFSDGMAPIKMAEKLCAGKTSDLDKVTAIFNWVKKNISYDRSIAMPSYTPVSIEKVYREGKGVCKHFAVTLAAMCRSQGVKAKYVTGLCKPVGLNPQTDYHAWNEVYVDGEWKVTDASSSSANGQPMFMPRSDYSIIYTSE